jgi:prepilin peptidase CpaA
VHHSLVLDLLLLAGGAILVVSGLHDFAFRTVPNCACLALLVLGLLLRILDHHIGYSLLAGGLILALTFGFWFLGWMGGGDVKLLTAAAVFVPPLLVPTLIMGTALSGGLLALAYLVGGKFAPAPALGRPHGLLRRVLRCELWRLHRRGPLPYAAAIATGGVLATLAY